MNPGRCPIWTPLYWHRRCLQAYVAKMTPVLGTRLRARFGRQTLRVCDLGCGSMPYRETLLAIGGVEYLGADINRGPVSPDLHIDAVSQRVIAPDESCHAVVHFQVLEHVPDYRTFLLECFRLLQPGGLMLCTVPFAFEFHAVPCDYRRWSSEGLSRDLTEAGFSELQLEGIEPDLLSVVTIGELYLAARLGYVITKPFFLALNALAKVCCHSRSRGVIPLTNGALCQKPDLP